MKLRRPTLRSLLVGVALTGLLLGAALDVYRHSTWMPPSPSRNTSGTLWVDYGKLHVYAGGGMWFDGWEVRVLWWPVQEWSWHGPGHLSRGIPRVAPQ